MMAPLPSFFLVGIMFGSSSPRCTPSAFISIMSSGESFIIRGTPYFFVIPRSSLPKATRSERGEVLSLS